MDNSSVQLTHRFRYVTFSSLFFSYSCNCYMNFLGLVVSLKIFLFCCYQYFCYLIPVYCCVNKILYYLKTFLYLSHFFSETDMFTALKIFLGVCVSCVQLLATPWTIACQAALSINLQARVLEWVAIPFSRVSS